MHFFKDTYQRRLDDAFGYLYVREPVHTSVSGGAELGELNSVLELSSGDTLNLTVR